MRDELELMHPSQNQIVFKLRTGLKLVEAQNLTLTRMGRVANELPNIQQQLIWYKKYRQSLNNSHRAIKSVLQTAEQYLENVPMQARESEMIQHSCDALSNNWIRLLSRVSLWNTQLRIRARTLKPMKQSPQQKPQPPSHFNAKSQIPSAQFRTWREQLDFTIDCIKRLNRDAASIPELSSKSRRFVSDLNSLVSQLKLDVERELFDGKPQVHESVSFADGWKSAEIGGIFYYIDTNSGTSQWDHPAMASILSQLSQFNSVRFAAYRTALKLRSVQKELKLQSVAVETLKTILNPLSLGDSSCDKVLTASDMTSVLSSIYNQEADTNLLVHLALNYFTNCFNNARHGGIRNLSFQVGLVLLCSGNLETKLKYLIALITEGKERINGNHLKVLLQECTMLPRHLGETVFFRSSNIELSVRSCFERVNNPPAISAADFLAWVNLGPQLLVWLHVLQRIIAGENVVHPQRCDSCKLIPICGMRFRCLRCFNFNLCQTCFLNGKRSRGHRPTHPVHEYHWEATSCENTRDFVRAFKNRFKSKRRLAREASFGYLPIPTKTNLEDTGELQEAKAQNIPSGRFSLPPEPEPIFPGALESLLPSVDDEHRLIAEYCQSLQNSSPSETQSQHQIQLDSLLRSVEEENEALEREYELLCSTMDPELTRSVLHETRLLRKNKRRLRRRMIVLHEHKAELEEQLRKLQTLNTTAS